MKKAIYFVCPTDCLENEISQTYKGDKFFYTSLGNTFSTNHESMTEIAKLIKDHKIEEIHFILSDQNQIILDAIKDQAFNGVRGLASFYTSIQKQWKESEKVWQTIDQQHFLLSYFLNNRITEMHFQLGAHNVTYVEMIGKIYKRDQGVFCNIYPDLIYKDRLQLN